MTNLSIGASPWLRPRPASPRPRRSPFWAPRRLPATLIFDTTNANITLGNLSDGGTVRTITVQGGNTLTLNGITPSLQANTKFVVSSGTTLSTPFRAPLSPLGTAPVVWDGGTYGDVSNSYILPQLLSGTGMAGANNVNLVAGILTLGDSSNLSTTINGTVSGIGGITAAGTGTVTLAGSNSYTGLTSVTGGSTMIISGTNSSATGATTVGSGTLELDNASNGGLASGLLSLNGGALQSLVANAEHSPTPFP